MIAELRQKEEETAGHGLPLGNPDIIHYSPKAYSQPRKKRERRPPLVSRKDLLGGALKTGHVA